MKRSILIPTDFSDNAWNSIVYALKLYANEECTFYFLHTWSVLGTKSRTYITSNFAESLEEASLKQLIETKEMADQADSNSNHTFNIILKEGRLDLAIEKAIKKHHIDIVIMGTRGVHTPKEMFFGSNVIATINKMKLCPILAVPDMFEFEELKQIAFPTDFSRFFGDELQPIKDMADLYDSKIRIVHITKENNLSKKQDYNLCMLKVYLENHPHSFHWMPNYANKTKEISDFVEELNVNMLVMINYEHSFIESIIKEPVVSKIGFRPTVPFLVIPCAI